MENTNNHAFAPTSEELKVLLDSYEQNKKLPTNYVRCTKTGTQVMMFGDNLKNRIEKFGSLETLLTTFICNEQMRADKKAGLVHEDQPKLNKVGTKKKELTRTEVEAIINMLKAQLAALPTEEVQSEVTDRPKHDCTATPTIAVDESQETVEVVNEEVEAEEEAEEEVID